MSLDPDAIAAFTAFNRKLFDGMLKAYSDGGGGATAEVFKSLTAGAVYDTSRWLGIQEEYYRKHIALYERLTSQSAGESAQAVAVPEVSDRRFRSPEWRQPYFQHLAQLYLLRSQWLDALVEAAPLETHAKRKLRFFVRQAIDAMSPANFLWSNPESLKLAFESKGESLVRGLHNMTADAEKGIVSTNDEHAFEVGRNLAITPGAVVFENALFQLIQYRPVTPQVYERPLLIVPPCINKYYILDLQPENSFVRHVVSRGHTVFMVSWRNTPPMMGHVTWDDYLQQGVLEAVAKTSSICRTEQINALGFCVGGTLLACALAVLRARGENRVSSLTLLAAMLDYRDTGDLSVFVDEAYVERRERDFAAGGVLQGRELALTFASLRANDLVWQYVVNNYLKGETPPAFDLLYWNADSTNLPGAMYVYYIRNMYLENNLRVPGRLTMCGVPIDLSRLDMPAYTVATREDHIVPWQTAFASARLLTGKIEFVLGASGHIAGIVNPASRNRRKYWVNARLPDSPQTWLEGAESRPGSWWMHWSEWLERHGGRQVAARGKLGGEVCKEIEPAPGRYVKEKCAPAAGA
jgi:poly[(R)-3-hydroxyalkanoate] polymerase subunit PhaC